MSIQDGFGKKQERTMELDSLTEIESVVCPNCGTELIRLEYMIGPDLETEEGYCYTSYSILICSDCGAKYKKREAVYKYLDQNDPGHSSLRWK